MIAYDGPARLALIIIAGCLVLTGLAIFVGKMIDAGQLDAPDADDEPDVDAPNAEVLSLDGHRALRPRAVIVDDITLAAERVVRNAPMPPRDAS